MLYEAAWRDIVPNMPKLENGTIVAGHFRITGVIGQGGMGTVYQAEHLSLPVQFAIKVLRQDLARNRIFVERFRREAVAASLSAHPNIVAITDFGQLPDIGHYMVMEYLEGETVEERMDRLGRLGIQDALHVLLQLADAIEWAHKAGVVHRDLKLENLLLCAQRGKKDILKIVDFGIAEILDPKYRGQAAASIKGQVFGTPEYMSPEQAMDKKQDGRSDIYSMGILAFELVTGAPPFTGNPSDVLQAHLERQPSAPSSVLAGHPVPPAFDACVLRCLAKDPNDRYPTAGLLRRDLLRIRAMLAGMADSVLKRKKTTRHKGLPQETDGLWRPIGTIPEAAYQVVEPPNDEPTAAPVGPTGLQQDSPARGTALRETFHQSLKELALALAQAGVQSEQMHSLVDDILQVEEESEAFKAQITLMEQNFDRIRFETAEKESVLRFAIMDLSTERQQMPPVAPDAETKIKDLDFQLNQLSKRLQEVTKDKETRIRSLEEEVAEYRQGQASRQDRAASLYMHLYTVMTSARGQSTDPKLKALYEKVEQAKGRLEQLRRVATNVL